jgi:hypothetical protein
VSGLLALGLAYIMASVGSASAAASWCGSYAAGATLAGTFLLAAPGRTVPPGLLLVAAVVFVVLLVGFGLALLLPAEAPDGPLLLGLPRRAGVVLLGVGLVPALVLPWAYARAAAADPLDTAAIRALVEECEALRREAPSS